MCATIGIAAAMMGMPLGKRTARAAELDAHDAKERPILTERERDRRRVDQWLDVLRKTIDDIERTPSAQRTTHDVKGTLLSIGAAINLETPAVLAMLGGVQASLRRIRDDIVEMRPYNMQLVLTEVNNAVNRLTRMELMADLANRGALTAGRESYIDRMPADLQPLVAAFAQDRPTPAVKFDLDDTNVYVFGTNYVYTHDSEDMDRAIDVWTLAGFKINRFYMDLPRDMDLGGVILFEAPTPTVGGQLWCLAPHDSRGGDNRALRLPPDCTMLAAVDPTGRRAVAFSSYDAETEMLLFKTFAISERGLELDGVHKVPKFALSDALLREEDMDDYDSDDDDDRVAKIVQFVDDQLSVKLPSFREYGDRNSYPFVVIDLAAKTFEYIDVISESDIDNMHFVGRTHVIVNSGPILLIPRDALKPQRFPYDEAPSSNQESTSELDLASYAAYGLVERYDIKTSLHSPDVFVGVNRFLVAGKEFETIKSYADGEPVKVYTGHAAELYLLPHTLD